MLHDVLEAENRLRQRSTQERRSNIDLVKLPCEEPAKLQLLAALHTGMGTRLVEELRCWAELNAEAQTDLMIGLARMLEEVLDDVEQVGAVDTLIELFHHLAFERAPSIFAGLDASSGKRPVLIAFQAVEQYEAIVSNNCRGAKLKAMTGNVYGDHLCALTFDMSGDRRHAKHAGGRPLDGRVRYRGLAK